MKDRRSFDVGGTRMGGQTMVVEAKGLRVGQYTDRKGNLFATLTRARRMQMPGQALVRLADTTVVSIKGQA